MANPEQLATNKFGEGEDDGPNAPHRSPTVLEPPRSRPMLGNDDEDEATVLDARVEDLLRGQAPAPASGPDDDDDDEATSQADAKRMAAGARPKLPPLPRRPGGGPGAPIRVPRSLPLKPVVEDEATNMVSSETLDTGDITDASAVPGPADIAAAAADFDKMTDLASRSTARSKTDRKSSYIPSLSKGGPGEADIKVPKIRPKAGSNLNDMLVGSVLDGRYQVVERVGMGGMGAVYRGRHVTINKDVAIKVLAPQLAQWPVYVDRFLQEARAASMLRHPNVVTITDFGFTEADNLPYFVMEYLEGEDLRDRLQRLGRMGWSDARPIVLQMCSALDAAHRKGVIHRDIKPENCFLLSQDEMELVKLVDFGIAKVASESEENSLTSHGVVLGTVEYISPERANKQAVDARADIYSLGVLIYRMLTGRTPFVGEAVQVVTSHVYDPPPPMYKVAPDAEISPELEVIVLKTLAKRPEDRYQTVAELATALQSVPVPGAEPGHLPGFQRAPTLPPQLPGASKPGLGMPPPVAPAPHRAPGQPARIAPQGGYAAPRSRTKLVVGLVFLALFVLLIVWSVLDDSSGESVPPDEGASEPTSLLIPAG